MKVTLSANPAPLSTQLRHGRLLSEQRDTPSLPATGMATAEASVKENWTQKLRIAIAHSPSKRQLDERSFGLPHTESTIQPLYRLFLASAP